MPVVQNFNYSIEVTSFFNLVLVWNHGVSFGMFNDGVANPTQVAFLSAFTLTVVGVIIYLLAKVENKVAAIAYGLVIGGAIGNLIDRVLYGAVVDFLDFHAFGYHWFAFNIADSIILIGVLLLVFEGFFVKDGEHEKK
jgi:signal peptidase II